MLVTGLWVKRLLSVDQGRFSGARSACHLDPPKGKGIGDARFYKLSVVSVFMPPSLPP